MKSENTLPLAFVAPGMARAVTMKSEIKEEYGDGADDSIDNVEPNCKSERDDDDDHGHGMTNVDHKLSRELSKFLRYTAYDEDLLGDGDWIALPLCCESLGRTEDEVTTAVMLSDRTPPTPTWYEFDNTAHDARFELRCLGSRSWIRATDGEYYRCRTWTKEGWVYEREF
jgi:hypothetical protein